LDIIKATGANAFGSSDSSLRRNDCHIDFVVVDSLSLPPHATAIPARVTKALRKVSACNHGDSEPVIADLSWVTQCIVRKSFIDVHSDKRYQVLLGNDKKDETRMTELFSIKVEHGSCKSRYEVGDSIRFGKGNMSVSYGRIIGIEHNKSNQKHIVEVKVLVSLVLLLHPIFFSIPCVVKQSSLLFRTYIKMFKLWMEEEALPL
jgi:hypothetical protein